MDAKITLSFDKEVIDKAKAFASAQGISLSRLTEYLYSQITSDEYKGLEDLPIASWVSQVAEGEVEYHKKKRGRKEMTKSYFEDKR